MDFLQRLFKRKQDDIPIDPRSVRAFLLYYTGSFLPEQRDALEDEVAIAKTICSIAPELFHECSALRKTGFAAEFVRSSKEAYDNALQNTVKNGLSMICTTANRFAQHQQLGRVEFEVVLAVLFVDDGPTMVIRADQGVRIVPKRFKNSSQQTEALLKMPQSKADSVHQATSPGESRRGSGQQADFDPMGLVVPYRETILARGEAKYRHKKQTGGDGQFAEVWMRIEPKPRDTGLEFTESLVGQNVDQVFVPSVEKGVRAACAEGIIAGYPVVDVRIDFCDGKMHPVDSNDIAFQIAGKKAFKEAFLSARPCLLEPICAVEVRVPDESVGAVLGDLSSRRGAIRGLDSTDGVQVVKAHVPRKELYRYAGVLRSLTAGRGIHVAEFSHYEMMPRELEQKVIADHKKDKAAGQWA